MPAYDSNNIFAKSCAANSLAKKSMRMTTSGLSRHHAAVARPHAGDPEGAGAQHPRHHAGGLRHVARGAHKIAAAAMTAFKADGITVQHSTKPPADRWCFICTCT